MGKSILLPALRALMLIYCLFLVHSCKKSNDDNGGDGSFSGTTYLSTDANLQEKQVITEGEFFLKRLQ